MKNSWTADEKPDGYIDIEDVENMFREAMNMSVSPDKKEFPKYKEGDVIDEDQSVRWNREEVQRRMEARKAETERLQKAAQYKYKEAYDLGERYVEQGIGCNEVQAADIWSFTYNKHHDNLARFFEELDELIDLFKEYVKDGKECN